MPGLDPAVYLDHLRSESARFRAVLGACEPAAPVPACPDWDAADLLWHLTKVQSFWAKVISTRPTPATQEDESRLARPETYDQLLAAFDAHSADLQAALAAAAPEETAWHWSSDQTVGASYRRQAHEALIHRVDAEETAGALTALDATLAADGVHECLTVMYGGCPPWGTITASERVVGLHLTDVEETFHIALARFTGTDPDGTSYDEADLALVDSGTPLALISGTAAGVDQWLWHRGVGRVDLEFEGDDAALGELREILNQPIN